MHYMETYNASEGFFGLQNDPLDHSMLLMIDYGVFFEFIPLDEVGKENGSQTEQNIGTGGNLRLCPGGQLVMRPVQP